MKIPIAFNAQQVAESNDSFSPSAGKPIKVIEEWKAKELPIEIIPSDPLAVSIIAKAHDRSYVSNVLALLEENGFGNFNIDVADSLLYTTGSFMTAAELAFTNRNVAMSPTSGFHHAMYDSGGGFCTFNGLMIAAIDFKDSGFVNRVGILDLDMHFGNGTEDIIKKLEIDYVDHYTFGGIMISKETAEHWLNNLAKTIHETFENSDIVFYQAGADPHIDDPLGGVLTSDQMRRRDAIVFQTLKEMGKPVAWNLAGGYQKPLQKVLDIHTATMEECIKVYR